jgi:hypothetical protein
MNRLLALAAIAITLLAMGWLNFHWSRTPLDLSPIVVERVLQPASAGQASDIVASRSERYEITETLLRPLFHSNRRPFEPAPAPVVDLAVDEEAPLPVAEQEIPIPTNRPELRLAGISVSGNRKRALLGLASSPEIRWYSQGENVDGWVVASITHETVTLESGGQSFVMPLYPPSMPGSGEQ